MPWVSYSIWMLICGYIGERRPTSCRNGNFLSYAITTVIQNRKYVTINYSGRAAFGLVAWGRQTKHLNSISIYVLFPSYKYPHFIRTQLPTLHIMSRWSGFKKCGHRYAMAVWMVLVASVVILGIFTFLTVYRKLVVSKQNSCHLLETNTTPWGHLKPQSYGFSLTNNVTVLTWVA